MIAFLIVVAAVILFEAAVLAFGADSRDGNDWRTWPPGGNASNRT